MAEPTNETQLVAKIIRGVKKRHPQAWIFKVHGGPMQMSGVPDILMSIDGLIIGAEVKHQKPGESEAAARGRATAGQRNQIHLINWSGGMAGVVLSLEETLDLIDRAFKKRAQLADEGEIA